MWPQNRKITHCNVDVVFHRRILQHFQLSRNFEAKSPHFSYLHSLARTTNGNELRKKSFVREITNYPSIRVTLKYIAPAISLYRQELQTFGVSPKTTIVLTFPFSVAHVTGVDTSPLIPSAGAELGVVHPVALAGVDGPAAWLRGNFQLTPHHYGRT